MATWAIKFVAVAGLSAALAACSGGSGGNAPSPAPNPPPANQVPTAHAGAAQNVLSGDTVTLDGSASSDPDKDALSYRWTLDTRPAKSAATLAGANTAKPTFVADVGGDYKATLVVNDGKLDSPAVSVAINANTRPVAVATNTAATDVVPGKDSVTLDGSGSTDADGHTLSYKWALSGPAGSTAMLSSNTAAKPSFTPDKRGEYTATLVVNDGKVDSAPTSTKLFANTRPVAAASASASVVLPAATVTVDGTSSSDADGDALSYAWALTARPAGSAATLSSASAAKPTFVADKAGAYALSLKVSDGRAESANTATVNVLANTAPVASLSVPATGFVGQKDLMLDGRASADPDGNALTYQWTVSPATGSVAAPTAASTAFVPGTAGVHTATLTVSDGNASHSASKSFTVDYDVPRLSGLSVPAAPLKGQSVQMSVSVSDLADASPSVTWSFSNTATTYSGTTANHVFPADADVTVTVTARNKFGKSASLTQTVRVVTASATNPQTPDCTGANCGAASATAYSGSGVGVWKYTNSGSGRAAVNLNLSGIPVGKQVRLVMSKDVATSYPSTASNVFDWGRSVGTSSTAKRPGSVRSFGAVSAAARAVAAPVAKPASVAPGTQRGWSYAIEENVPAPVTVPTTALPETCAANATRNVVFWAAMAPAPPPGSAIAVLKQALCGASAGGGVLPKLESVMGAAIWGAQAGYIPDSPVQDINVVFMAKSTTQLPQAAASYLFQDVLPKASASTSNEALVIFVDGDSLKNSPEVTSSAVIQVMARMVNRYQRWVAGNNRFGDAGWLQNLVVRMAEDLVSPSALTLAGGAPYAPTADRMVELLASGGGASVVSDAYVQRYSYEASAFRGVMGGFAGYLNRKYGSALLKRLGASTSVLLGPGSAKEWAILDSHIKALGGVSADEDFFRFGASAFGTLAATNIPTGFGFPSRVEGSWTLPAIDLSALSPSAPGTYTALGAASQTYAWPLETQSNASGTYSRTNIVVPAGVTLQVLVK